MQLCQPIFHASLNISLRIWQKSPPPMTKQGNFLHLIYRFHAISSYFGSADRTPPPHDKTGKFFRLDLSISFNFQQLLFSWQKSPTHPPSPPPHFCLFMRDPASIMHVEYLWSPYYKSTLRFLLSKYLL